MTTISIDAMGGDFGLAVTVPASVQALTKNPDLQLILVGDQSKIEQALARADKALLKRVQIQHASQQVEMDESPSNALRKKKDSSMRVALNRVKQGDAGACVSAGNTGALMATSRFVLKMLPGIDRPAICGMLPTERGTSYMLDLGANIDATPESLFQFAVMGAEFVSAVARIQTPTIGLLNIGEEEIKGNEMVKQAAELLSRSDLNYHGFVEGDDIYKGTVDVVVSDGFVGNIALKASEGLAHMVSHFIRTEFKRTLFTKIAGLIAMPVLNAFRGRIDPRNYNGASLLGLKGIVVKSHGGTDITGFQNAIHVAVAEVEHAVPQKIEAHLHRTLVEGKA
ncbi:MAG: phosphate acyltransferase PlsX [Gammaproteobacteria bacterium]|jgi:glycerol-3-phosphate acyltransferase PlsX|nr:phosphate acyltransferase PlsX [Gammaproteobacteria bacterium]MBT3488122.1 phosphate acyltransferase PlsX [Gammaproteobacteria bacterium]MBT3717857.1 phosphate acyltransferase PlsX [Gammaproteobacteria bacterium]MBT3845361.1 phosphate acyltransferase PlsX [Gammaproteobacteria bacterium]MBT3894413.1 phosphate acyltransferase PlsX [Gammaproteobacteria bacterium]